MAKADDPMGVVRVEHVLEDRDRTSNAQVALAAASRVYGGGRGYSRPQVLELAEEFLTWLDAKDADGR